MRTSLNVIEPADVRQNALCHGFMIHVFSSVQCILPIPVATREGKVSDAGSASNMLIV
ncbi:hypothetical protein GCM10009794_10330 [Rothia terrae]